MDKNKTILLNLFSIFIILNYFVINISCDECTIKAICFCEPKSHSNKTYLFGSDSLQNKFITEDKLNLCKITTQNGSIITVSEYVLNCTYIDTTNSSSFNPPNGTKNENTFSLNLNYSCTRPPPPSKYSTGSVLVIIFFTCILSYLTLGICVNYILIGARGIEMLPHLDFWKDFPALVLDGVKFLQNGCTARPSDLSAPAGAEGYDAI